MNVKTVNLHSMGIVIKDVTEDGHRVYYACHKSGLEGMGRSVQSAFDDLQRKQKDNGGGPA